MNWLITIHILLLKLRSPYNGTPAQGNRRRFSKRGHRQKWRSSMESLWRFEIVSKNYHGADHSHGQEDLGILPGALAGRQNWVLSNNLTGNQDIRVFKSIEEAINAAEGKAIFFIGGEQIYTGNL